jgi:hypothetical protein
MHSCHTPERQFGNDGGRIPRQEELPRDCSLLKSRWGFAIVMSIAAKQISI